MKEKKNDSAGEVRKAVEKALEKSVPICPKCGSKEIRARIMTGELWCRRCGHVGKKKDFFNK